MSDVTSAVANGPAAKRYAALETDRLQFTAAAEQAAKYTIPSVFPPVANRSQWKNQKIVTRTPWQNIGARGSNNLASKLLLALIPPNQPFFRFMLDDQIAKLIADDPDMKEAVEVALQNMEQKVMDEVEMNNMRVDVFEMLKHLVITGNYLLFVPKDGALKGFDLADYVVKRNRRGDVLEIVVREGVDEQSAEPRIRDIIYAVEPDRRNKQPGERNPVYLYTRIVRNGDRFSISQEVLGTPVPGSSGYWPVDQMPWLALRFRKIEGENYGRGLVEEHIGDLKSLDRLQRAIVQGAEASAKVLFGVEPGATVNPRLLSKLDNLGFFQAKKDEVWALQIQKGADFQVAQQTITQLKEELAFVFMLNSAIQREGERVTAEEIRFMAGELEDALGGVYSLLSQEFQQPLVQRIMVRLQSRGAIPSIPKGDLKPAIVTGLEAIGRGYELTRLQGWAQDVQVLAQIDPNIVQYINAQHWLIRTAIARGIEIKELVKSPQQMQAEQQAQQQQVQQQAQQGMAAEALHKGVGAGAAKLAQNAADIAVPPQGGQLTQQALQPATLPTPGGGK